jgi:hypothetical protein
VRTRKRHCDEHSKREYDRAYPVTTPEPQIIRFCGSQRLNDDARCRAQIGGYRVP